MSCRVLPCVLMVLLLSSCQKTTMIFSDQKVTIEAGSVKELVVDAPKTDQQVDVTLEGNGDLEAYLVAGSPKAVVELLQNGRTPAAGSYVAISKVQKKGELRGKVPAGSEYAVILSNPGGTTKEFIVSIRGSTAR